MIGARHGAVSATNALFHVDAYQLEFVFMHSTRRAHVNALGAFTVIARQRNMVCVCIRANDSMRVGLARSAFVINHASIRTPRGKVAIISAGHDAGAAARAKRIVEIKPASQNPPPSKPSCHCMREVPEERTRRETNTPEYPKAPHATGTGRSVSPMKIIRTRRRP